MSYNDDYWTDPVGWMSFGPGAAVAGGSTVGISWTSKFSSDAIAAAQFTWDGTDVGSPIGTGEALGSIDYRYNEANGRMDVWALNLTSSPISVDEVILAHSIPAEWLTSEDGFWSDPASAEGVLVPPLLMFGELAPDEEALLGSYPFKDGPGGPNNTGYLLTRGVFTDLGSGWVSLVATGAFGTVIPEPATLVLLAIAGLVVGLRRR
jgi:hypothetical protein